MAKKIIIKQKKDSWYLYEKKIRNATTVFKKL